MTMNKATLFLTSLLLFGITACKENREAHITRLVQEWSGKEIQFPEHPVFTLQGKDTVEAPNDGNPGFTGSRKNIVPVLPLPERPA